ncbi:hemolysin family protein [uncultured Paludibaculum sp.]|uniref:hemolysin family protein n=1 Tax=uncultured Paludibaculum sp. TaxID=1765020 RepID=UPI002AAADC8A|nr:hemolysin family protein [uncultured Paludibaculum sp.]
MEDYSASYGYRLMLMFIIIGVNGFFAAAETALVSVRPSRLRQMADQGVVGAHAAMSLLANPERLLSVSQVGLTLASLALGWLGEETLESMFSSLFSAVRTPATHAVIHVVSLVCAFAVMTFTHVVFGEVVPKNLAIDKSDRLAVIVAPVLLVFYKLVEPFVWVIERASGIFSRMIGVHGHQHGAHSPEELKFVVSASHTAGHLTEFEQEAISRIIDLQEVSVRQVMVPRNQLVTVDIDADIDEVLQLMSGSRYSRLPVCQKSLENPIGFVHVKDVLDFWAQRRKSNSRRRAVEPFKLSRIVRKAPIVPESRALHQVLDDLREKHAHVALVVDEFGTVSGLVSIEDVFEQIFGEIEDEFDLQTPPPLPEEDEDFEVDGATSLLDLETQYGVVVPQGDAYETVAGYLLFRLGRIPSVGDATEYDGRRYIVTQMDFNRIVRVRIDRLGTEESISS